MREALGFELCEFVSGPWSRAKDGSKIESRVTRGDVHFLGEENSVEVGTLTGSQFECC